jgi:uncharacterized alkaline shock family protein YloU
VNLFDRFILMLYSLSLLVFSGICIGVFSRLISPKVVEDFFNGVFASTTQNVAYLIVSLIVFIISVRFFFHSFAGPRRDREDKAITQRNDLGEVSISFETIRVIAERAAKRIRGVRDLKTSIRLSEQGAVVKLRVGVDGETPLPDLTRQLQYEVKEAVETIAGIVISEVIVIVAEVSAADNLAVRTRRLE